MFILYIILLLTHNLMHFFRLTNKIIIFTNIHQDSNSLLIYKIILLVFFYLFIVLTLFTLLLLKYLIDRLHEILKQNLDVTFFYSLNSFYFLFLLLINYLTQKRILFKNQIYYFLLYYCISFNFYSNKKLIKLFILIFNLI